LFADSCEVQCPLHDSRFSLVDGRPTGLPATKPVKTYAVRIDGDDILVGPQPAG
jgi:3-phenylpropionate/trans-cinnamate dioxygenase ferredoxin subunit